jgi:hypothetical protein
LRSSRFVLAAICALGLLGRPAFAESAADKATAREAATEGISLYRAGKYADALDRLKRAQALYDAPVHLLYIARAEDKLGQLVEAAETYRSLDRYTLPSGAPEAWTAAVDDGRKELAVLEPRIPKLKIVTDPASVPDAALKIDGVAVSAAVVGIERPVNPGKHHVEMSAPGFAPAAADMAVAEGASKDVTLHLTATGSDGTPTATAGRETNPPRSPSQSESGSRSLVGFWGGMRIGVGIPTGTLLHTPGNAGQDIPTSNAVGVGGALELHAGVRIARFFTPLLYIEGETLSAGDGFLGQGKLSDARAGAVGLGLMVGSAPNKLGGFGEIDLVLASSFNVTGPANLAGTQTCDLAAKGNGLRFGGGGVIPVSSWLHLTPVVLATLSRFSSVDGSGTCAPYPTGSIESDNRRTHGMIFIGVGGDVVLGRDL